MNIIRLLPLVLLVSTPPLHAAGPHTEIAVCPAETRAEGAAPPAGVERKCVTAAGIAEGPWLTWYGNGQLLSERNMKQGREHGRQRSWWPNGQLMMEGVSYEGNRYQGFKYWSVDGTPTELNIEIRTETKPLDSAPAAGGKKP